ncbi:MAG TPA: Hsp20/alpha crystallin family protein [Pirellulales bacterium]|jgi:HSP20 family protein|nr:Hsp20/alpha crystallin family protein [Pirellulales bacterium]
MATQTLQENGAQAAVGQQPQRGQYYRPNVDLVEKTDELLVIADLPGAKSDQIDIQFENGSLTIHAEVPQRRGENATYLLREFGVGDFYRTFRVSEQIDPARINAEYRDGVLFLHLPKAEAAKPRKITVNAASSNG